MPPDEIEVEQQRRRLETLGCLAGNVVHDFNNLLMVIDGYARMMLEEQGLSRSAKESAEEILQACGRAGELTQQLLAFSRKKSIAKKPMDLNGQLLSMRSMLVRLLGETVLLEYELSGDEVVIVAHQSQVEQVLLNLIVNARDAMPVGGRIVVRTRVDGDMVALELEDSGVGISAELQRKIFEPFFTTKPEGKGTGIGLALVAETVEEWGGRVELKSEEGNGARFCLWIPRVALVEGGGVVLLVEDEDGVRNLIRKVLEQRRYRVVECATEAEALRLAEVEAHLDLLITDLEIGAGTGTSVARLVRLRHPEVKVLFISGYLQEEPGPGEMALQKPFSPKTLVLAVQDLLKSD